MAEVKNSFLASKMNKDLDDRLIPGNEYKDALNIAVSNSEDSDVGAVENILQNTNIYPISSETNIGEDNGKIIGQIVNPATDDIYLFYTNYKDQTEAHQASSVGVNTISTIVRYNPDLEAGASSQLVIGRFLNFNENSPIYGINIIEDFLFWTDDRNQPRKINIRKASANRFHYTSEDDISVAKYAPYTPIDLYKSSNGGFKTTMKDVSSEKLPDGTTNNPDYNPNYAGDSNFLEDKFARFSYRFKYEDAEYSIMAPFTQIAFIPKQDGSFLDEDKTFQSTVVSFMENKVDQISLVINLPEIGTNLESAYKLKEIDILYKESDQIAISVLDTVTVEEVVAQAGSTNVYEYNYQSRKPVRTLPQTQSTRVYDKTPVRALAQEVSGNRVIYGNYINKHTAPDHLNYQVSVTQKFTSGFGTSYSYIEYPEHTLKRNRNYQVGFVLSDRYGRQSDVILSQVVDNIAADGIFGSSTFYFPYRKNATTPTTFLADVGNSIKIQLNEQIQSDRSPLTADNLASTGEPGLYDLSTNPTGWYSYKIVVKQTQQEYYNVYLPGFLKGDLSTGGPITATHSVLISDNINKVPRDLQEVGPVQNKYSSDEVLFPVVENVVPSSAGVNYNQPFFPENKKYEVTTIASFNDLNDLGGGAAGVDELFESNEDPLIMRIGDNKGGLGGTLQHMVPTLSIAETTPFVSNIDIYYETSTSGLISDLNTSVIADIGTPIFGFSIFDYTHRENQDPGGSGGVTGAIDSAFVTSDMFPVNNLNSPILTTSNASLTVTDNLSQSRTNEFELVPGTAAGSYRIKIKNSFYFGADANSRESYNFTISLRNSADNATANSNGTFSNVTSITVQNVVNTIFVGQTLGIAGTPFTGAKVTGVNGLVITFDTSISIPTTNTALTFLAPINTFTKQGALSNNSPLVAPPIAYVTPAFSTMAGLYATITAYNGAFSTADRTKGLQYRWSTLQPLINGAFTDFTINTAGNSSLITIGNNQITLAVDQDGKVSIVSGFFNFSVAFSLKITITDVGGLSTEATIVFDDVTAGAFTNAFSTAFDI